MQQRFDIGKVPVPPLRAEQKFTQSTGGPGHIQGVEATSGGLIRSALMAGGAALAILTFFWLPAEYGIDPTGVGGLMGLTEMGAIKQQLAGEAATQDAAAGAEPAAAVASATTPVEVSEQLERIETQLDQIAAIIGADVFTALPAPEAVATSAPAPEPKPEVVAEPAPAVAEPAEAPAPPVTVGATGWRDELVFTLAPTEAKEIKLVMAAGDVATFEWVADGGGVNYSQHGDDGGANEVRFEDGRASPGQDGTMTAPFAGNHGWFWRNRGDAPVTVTLRVGGTYAEMIEVE